MATSIDVEKGALENEVKTATEEAEVTYPLARQITVPGDSVHGPAGDLQANPVVVEGREGCIVLLGCILMAVTNMGFGMCQGALQDFYARGPYRTHRRASYPWSQVCRLCYAVSAVWWTTRGCNPTLILGSVMGVLGILFDAFATQLWQVFLTQGLMFGISSALTVPLILSLPSQWFLAHRGLATGIVGGCAGLGGATNAVVIRLLIARFHGTRETLAIIASIFAVVWTIALFLIKENRQTTDLWRILQNRLSKGEQMPVAKIQKRGGLGKLLHDWAFWSFLVAVFFSCFGYFTPFSYLPTYTAQVVVPHMSHSTSLTTIWPLVGCNLGMFLGRVLAGLASDRIGACQTLSFCLTTAGILQVVAWHFATTFPGVMAFSVTFGMFGGAAMSLIALVIAQIWGVNENYASAVGLGIVSTGPGSVAGPALAGAVLTDTQSWFAFQAISGAGQVIGGLVAAWAWYIGVYYRRRTIQ